MTDTDIREKLRRLGQRRETQGRREQELSDEIQTALSEAYGQISVAEAARLLGVHRTTVYRVYEPHIRAATGGSHEQTV